MVDHNIVFYADDGRIAGYNPNWVKTMLMVVVKNFNKVALQTNMGKKNAMVFNLGFILWKKVEAEYKRRVTGIDGIYPFSITIK